MALRYAGTPGNDALALDAGDEAFTFVNQFTAPAYQAANDQTQLADVNGDGLADITILIKGHVLATDPGWVL